MKKNTAVKLDWDVDLVVFFRCNFDNYEKIEFRLDLMSRLAGMFRDGEGNINS
jgi:hypothetical protein